MGIDTGELFFNVTTDTVRIDSLRVLHIQRDTKSLFLEHDIHEIGIQLISDIQLRQSALSLKPPSISILTING